jgi:hypothetical protein
MYINIIIIIVVIINGFDVNVPVAAGNNSNGPGNDEKAGRPGFLFS